MLMIPRRQRLGPKSFRFMDLPVEIRLQVAEYVLRNDAPLEWAWADEKNSKHVGKIRGVRSVNPFGLVSRQLYADTWGVFWEVNTFSFNVCHVWLLYYDGRAPFTETYAVFLRNIGMKAAMLLRSIIFSIDLVVNTTSDLESFLDWFIPLAKQTPAAQVQLRDGAWYAWGNPFDAAGDIGFDFMNKGYKLQSALAQLGYEKREARNWIIVPKGGLTTSEPDWATDVSDEAKLATLMGWLSNGL
jgi:hypothetical protein